MTVLSCCQWNPTTPPDSFPPSVRVFRGMELDWDPSHCRTVTSHPLPFPMLRL